MNTYRWSDEQIALVRRGIIPEGTTYAQCMYFCKTRLGIKFKVARKAIKENPKHEEYARMHAMGMSYTEIAIKVGLTRQRIGVIVKKWNARHPG